MSLFCVKEKWINLISPIRNAMQMRLRVYRSPRRLTRTCPEQFKACDTNSTVSGEDFWAQSGEILASASKANRLHAHIFRRFFIQLQNILSIPLQWSGSIITSRVSSPVHCDPSRVIRVFIWPLQVHKTIWRLIYCDHGRGPIYNQRWVHTLPPLGHYKEAWRCRKWVACESLCACAEAE